MQCPRCQHENPSANSFCGGCGIPLQHNEGSPQPAPSYADLQHFLTESLEQQTATSEILKVISSSPTDTQPVFDAIAANATRLCDAVNGLVLRFDGQLVHLSAHYNVDPERLEALQRIYPMPPNPGAVSGRVVLGRAVVHVPDVNEDRAYTLPAATTVGYRSVLGVPLLHDGVPLGTILIARDRVAPFSDAHIALLQTFADQAVIAIENVRLFKELQEKNRALTEAHGQVSETLERQTATSEILRVISSSLTDTNPVFRTILANANRLCDASFSVLWLWDGEAPTAVAHENVSPGMAEALRTARPLPNRRNPLGLSILDQTIVHIADVLADPRFAPKDVPSYRLEGARSILLVPMVREGSLVGLINIWRREPRAFTDGQIALVRTFADQAVIAIENVRLFTELHEKNRALTEAHAQVTETLEQQTATSEILRVISSSPTDVQPVFDTIVRSSARLCNAVHAVLVLTDGTTIDVPANYGRSSPEALAAARAMWPRPLDMTTTAGAAILTRSVVQMQDTEDPSVSDFLRRAGRLLGYRSSLAVPMLRGVEAIGAIRVARPEPNRFSDAEVELLKTFADQAVIAIENVRLFKELEQRNSDLSESLEQQTATGEILRLIAGSPTDLESVLGTVAETAARVCGARDAIIYRCDGDVLRLACTRGPLPGSPSSLALPLNEKTVAGRSVVERRTIHVHDLAAVAASEYPEALSRGVAAGSRTVLATPLLQDGEPLGAILIRRGKVQAFTDKQIALLETFADQAVIAIENVRLFKELEGANRELSVASQHKSEFLANMSHELRTPLNAIIGFSEVLSEKMFGELNQKQEEYSKDIHASGQHLLSLINDILDLSKIEAGRMELELSEFHLPTALDSAVTLVRERAGRRSIALHMNVDEQIGQIQADERKIRQVVLNLLSNAIKFTLEGGRIEVSAMPRDGCVEVSVADTGVGIAPEDQEAIFEEFRQVGTADKKAEGTGLGLTLCRKFIELHGGKIWVKSKLGMGSTFTFTIPVRRSE